VEWDSLEAHKEALTSPAGQRFLAAIEPLTTEFPDVRFYQPAIPG
jgi:quinol monooxygenase YgiN